MRNILLPIIFLLSSTAFADPEVLKIDADPLSFFEEEDSFLMHRRGVVIAFEGKKEHVFPEKITKDQLKNIIYLDFKENNIYELPSWISGLINLRTINLRNSKIKLDDLKKLSALKNIEIIDISKNIFFLIIVAY